MNWTREKDNKSILKRLNRKREGKRERMKVRGLENRESAIKKETEVEWEK